MNNTQKGNAKYGTCKMMDVHPYTITNADMGFCEIVDYSMDELLNNEFPCSRLLPNIEEVASEVGKELDSKDFAFMQTKIITKSARIKNIIFYAIKAAESSGKMFMHVIISDVSEDEMLNKMVSGILDTIPCGIIQYTFKSGEKDYRNMKLKYVNDNFYNITGYNEAQFESEHENSMLNMIYSQDKEYFISKFNECISETYKFVQLEFRLVKRSGEYVHLLCNSTHIVVSDGVDSIIGTFLVIDSIKETELMLKRSYDELAVISDSVSCGIVKIKVYSPTEFIVSYANESHARLTGYTFEQLGKYFEYNICHIIVESDLSVMREKMFSTLNENDENTAYIRLVRSDSKIIWVSVCVRRCTDKNGETYMLCVLSDVTEQKNMENELYIQTERYKLLEESTDEISFDYDASADTLTFPARAANGECEDKVIVNYVQEKKMSRTLHPNDYEAFIRVWREAMREAQKVSIECRSCIFGSGFKWYRMNFASFSDSTGNIIRMVGRMKDINYEKIEAAKLQEKIKTDPMTGLLNKNAMQLSCEEYIKISSPNKFHAVMIIDIDDFKNINDVFGHMFGDMVIENVATTIKNSFRATDFIGRIGGDEFMVLLKNTSHRATETKAAELCNAIKNLYANRSADVPTSCSIGIAYFPENGMSFEDLYSRSDIALYQSKLSGKNCFSLYQSTMKPIRKKRVQVDSNDLFYANINNYDVEFVIFAFSLLSNSRSLNSSINILLDRIGIRYGLTIVSVYENNSSDKSGIITNRWERSTGIISTENASVENYSRWFDFITRWDSKGYVCINDCLSDEIFEQSDVALLKLSKVRSVIGCSFFENEALAGYIGFCDCQIPRKWSDYEKNTFFELSKIIGVFVSLRKERAKNKKKIQELSTMDNLTGLLNSSSFKKSIEKYIEYLENGQCIAIVSIDINNFSYINENFGYSAGDNMLRDLANEIRLMDEAFGCRVYCDKFLVCISGKKREEILAKIKAHNESFILKQKDVYPAIALKVSIGIYFVENSRVNATLAIENANLIRKSVKKNQDIVCGVYSDDLRIKRNKEQRFIGGLHNAIERGDLELFLQPKFNIANHTVCGAEALSRWRNRDGTLKFPTEFILVLERVGYVVELDYYIYESVLVSLRKWLDDGLSPCPVSVNFSKMHINYDDFSERICALARKYDVPENLIEIEISESALASDSKKMLMHMENLREKGFRIDIDDFGTGYSALSLLLTAPVDIVKVDKSFLKENGNTEKENKYMRQLINLVFAAEKDLVFEGVETQSQSDFLLSCGVTMAQGFLFSGAMPAEEFARKYLYK